MLAVVTSRDGELAVGGAEAIAECGGRGLVVDVDGLRPATLAAELAVRLTEVDVVVMPASADGRSLAPRLAASLARPLVAGAVNVEPGRAVVARRGGTILEDLEIDGSYVATLEPGVRAVPVDLVVSDPVSLPLDSVGIDPTVEQVTTPRPGDLDLAEADHIVAVGAGIGDERFVALAVTVADALGMTLGATRVVTDWGWLPVERQIGTTGVMVTPDVYLALGISGAVQHTAGLGDPECVASVNTDGSCPMAATADLNIVADARAVLVAMADRLGLAVSHELKELVDG
jgi:electron transfer flavoprotein alpha subunit